MAREARPRAPGPDLGGHVLLQSCVAGRLVRKFLVDHVVLDGRVVTGAEGHADAEDCEGDDEHE